MPDAVPGIAETVAGPRVTLYSAPGCHLCEAARAGLERLAGRLEFELIEVDIHSDDTLARRWLLEIPVIEVDGEVATQAPIDLDRARRAIEAAAKAGWRR
ncbi:MAG: glutaredoxin family protein [Dehalococcoidia bacterium]